MASALVWILGSVALVSLISLVGAATLAFGALRRHTVALGLVALAAGTLIGDAFLHILPEATTHGFTTRVGMLVIAGFLGLFVMEVGLRLRHTHAEQIDDPHHQEHHDPQHVRPLGWINLVGDGMHNLLDGIIIAAAYLVSIPVGIATTIAVVLHEIPQELGDFAVHVRAGMRPRKALLLNLASAGLAVIGAVGVLTLGLDQATLEQTVLPLIAGAFVYIAAADLVPELHHHGQGREVVWILLLFLVGIAAMAGLLGLEGTLPAEAGHDH